MTKTPGIHQVSMQVSSIHANIRYPCKPSENKDEGVKCLEWKQQVAERGNEDPFIIFKIMICKMTNIIQNPPGTFRDQPNKGWTFMSSNCLVKLEQVFTLLKLSLFSLSLFLKTWTSKFSGIWFLATVGQSDQGKATGTEEGNAWYAFLPRISSSILLKIDQNLTSIRFPAPE